VKVSRKKWSRKLTMAGAAIVTVASLQMVQPATTHADLPAGCREGSWYDQVVWGYAGWCTFDGHTYWYDFDGGWGWAWWVY
jgi:hypothetical protein